MTGSDIVGRLYFGQMAVRLDLRGKPGRVRWSNRESRDDEVDLVECWVEFASWIAARKVHCVARCRGTSVPTHSARRRCYCPRHPHSSHDVGGPGVGAGQVDAVWWQPCAGSPQKAIRRSRDQPRQFRACILHLPGLLSPPQRGWRKSTIAHAPCQVGRLRQYPNRQTRLPYSAPFVARLALACPNHRTLPQRTHPMWLHEQ